MTAVAPRDGYRSLAGNREYVALLGGKALGLAGDQLARVALTVLVYDRTRSAVLAALVAVATYLPVVLGGPLLGGLADRTPRDGCWWPWTWSGRLCSR